jgi:hypothetical protein
VPLLASDIQRLSWQEGIMNLVLIFAITAIFLIATGALWYARPSGDVWLVASVALFICWGAAFLRLITRG